ncbi:DUF4255 domain-containing protein [Paracoccus sp. MBLB3053]|uniref:DUF4255 domain-containing protein n=1 Tax=Paracoccus aurantius TaxID=3073814 RepID=A0ABU2HYK9_9RHOB|nr:DUF4255 domain-containing protein [Paracoccus sp. MBLB3053]MDS9470137.1 DUF4255 domain-containing protein [Paracoccus sp. MBLB3053]
MSTALAIAGVTQLLRDLLNDGIVDNDVAAAIGTNVTVHARAPDRLDEVADGASILNVFLYQVSNQPNWANQVLPTRDSIGNRVANTPLTLDLYYLISASSPEDLHADILLGYAMQILHEHPGLTRDEIMSGLNPSPVIAGGLPPALQALAQTGLADQIEALAIAPVYLGLDEASKLWTAFQTNYRSSMAYRVSTVVISREEPSSLVLPVLTIGAGNSGPMVAASLGGGFPLITGVNLPEGQPSARPGDVVTLLGRGLEGAEMFVRFDSPILPGVIEIPPDPGGTAGRRTVTIPDDPPNWAAGPYRVSLFARAQPGAPLYGSNTAAIQIAPIATLPPDNVARGVGGAVEVTLSMRPNLWPGQRVELALGGALAVAPARSAAQGDAVFTFGDLPAGAYPVRLRVEGAESWLILRERLPQPPDFLPEPPIFDPAQTITVPA